MCTDLRHSFLGPDITVMVDWALRESVLYTYLQCLTLCHPSVWSSLTVVALTSRSEGKGPSRYTGGQSNCLRNGLLLGRSKVLRSLRHYLRAQSQRHHTIDRLEERGVER